MRLDLGNNNISLNIAGLSESDIAYEYMSTSLTCAEMIREIDNDLTVMDNLIQIGSYLKQYGATEAFVALVDANGQLSSLIGSDYSLERLDDAITKFSGKITEKLNWFFTRLGHKITTWFPTINRYEKLYNEGVSALRNREVDYEAVLSESVRGIKAAKLQSVLKFRKDSLADLKKAVQMIDGGVEQVLTDFDDTTIFRFGVIAHYKKDSLFHKLFQKQELKSLGYDAASLKRVVEFGKEMFDLYDDFEQIGSDLSKATNRVSTDIRRFLNSGDKSNARAKHKQLNKLRTWIYHICSFYSVSLDQMTDEAAFAAYTVQKMKKHIKY